MPILHAIEIRRVLSGGDRLHQVRHVGVRMQPPAEPLLCDAQERLQRVGDTQLPLLAQPQQVQVHRDLSKWRHLLEQRHFHHLLREPDPARNHQALAGRAQGRQGHELAAPVAPDERLSVVRLRDLGLEGGEYVQDARDRPLELVLLGGAEKLQEVLGRLRELVLRVRLVAVSPIRPSPLHGVQHGLYGADAVVVSGNGVSVPLHATEHALGDLAAGGARPRRRGAAVLWDADHVDARRVLLDAHLYGALDAGREDAEAQRLVRGGVRGAALRHGQDRLLPPLF
mmetsp:Transcript_107336/g.290861  ORF Transcript_107336/g.290861 Transcript_107336/m.290861 type:complete len:284 (-) Transcript_107336:1228-2079(-)